MSDSSFHKRPYSIGGRPRDLDRIDDAWAADSLSDDEVDVHRHELVIAPLLDEGDLDIDAVVVSNGQMGSAFSNAVERRRKEGTKWTDLALDQSQFDLKGKRDCIHTNSMTSEAGRSQPSGSNVESHSSTERDLDRSSDASNHSN